MKTVLVTGGAGFIGGYVVEELLGRGYIVHILDSRGRTVPGAITTLGDIRDTAAVGHAVWHADGVIHLAGVLGTAEMIAAPRPAIEVNVFGALNVFEAAATHGSPVVNIATGNHWMDNTYSISKDTADRFARMFVAFRGGRITTVRAFDAYGPRQVPAAPFGPSRVRKIIPSFICRSLTGLPIEVYGDGEQVIDLIYVARCRPRAGGRVGDDRPGWSRDRPDRGGHGPGDNRPRDGPHGDRERRRGKHRPSADASRRDARRDHRRPQSASRDHAAGGRPAAHGRVLPGPPRMIYSANYGAWDPPRAQPVPVRLFTEATHPLATTARYLNPPGPRPRNHPPLPQTQNRLDAKWWKVRPDLACPDAEVTIWVDASVTILRPDFEALALAELGDDDALFMRHPWRDCIYEEADASMISGLAAKYGGQFVAEQMEHYRAQGHPEHWGLVQSTVIVRRNNDRVRALDEAWWAEITEWSIQDQLSLPYVLRTADLRWHYWPVNPILAGWLRWGTYNT